MAMVDDAEWLLSHIQHSFITSDETGMCEMVIQNNDLYTLDEHRQRLRQKAAAERQNTASDHVKAQAPRAPSPDITSGWDFGVRRRSNTAQKLERIRKERQSRVKIKTVHWKQMPEKFVSEQLDMMFEKKDVRKRVPDLLEEEAANVQTTETNSSLLENNLTDTHVDGTKELRMQQNLCDIPIAKKLVASFQGFHINDDNLGHSSPEKAKNVLTKASALSRLLEKSAEVTHEPFKEFSKFDGRGHEGSSSTQRINMFVHVYGEPAPKFSIPVVILKSGAKIQDLIGLTCYRYCTEKIKPDLKRDDAQGYALYISEDDGEVDYGFPPLDSSEPVSKFSFPTLALVEKRLVSGGIDNDENNHGNKLVQVNDHTGFSLIQVDDLNITMGQILKKALKRRKGNKYSGVYRLELQDKPGVVVDEDQTLESTGTMEFCMVREHSARSKHNYPTANQSSDISNIQPELKPQNPSERTVQYIGLPSLS